MWFKESSIVKAHIFHISHTHQYTQTHKKLEIVTSSYQRMMKMGSVEKFAYKHPNIFVFIFGMIIGFLVIFAIPFFPPKISHTVALEILRVIVQVDGVLIGFTGLTISVLIKEVGRIYRREVILSGIFTIVAFLMSIFCSLVYMSGLTFRDFIFNFELGLTLFFMCYGIGLIVVITLCVYPPRRF